MRRSSRYLTRNLNPITRSRSVSMRKIGGYGKELKGFYYELLPEVGVFVRDYREFKRLERDAFRAMKSGDADMLIDALDDFIESDAFEEISDSGIQRAVMYYDRRLGAM